MMDASRPVTVALPTLGCKANRYDSDTLARALIARGYVIVPPGAHADVYIVNTCTVTREADAKSRKTLRRALRLNDAATLIVTGCYATRETEQLAAIDGVDAVVPLSEQQRIPELVAQLRPTMVANAATAMPLGLSASIERTRATVKIQDGCNQHCAYCAVTLARGPLCSRPIAEVIAELEVLVQAGLPEIVLTGIRLDAYGLDLPATRLADLLDATAALGIPRLRLSSLEPMGIDMRLIERLAAHPTLCRHFHLCLQAGDDGVLHAMRRDYTTAEYRELVANLRTAMPDATFTTDVIVGFPGEDDAAFTRSHDFIAEMGFIKLHIFPFSPRPGTAAATMRPSVPDAVKEARGRALQELERALFRRYAASLLNAEVDVLVERTGAHGNGLTPSYLRVHAPFSAACAGRLVRVRVIDLGDDHVLGQPQ